jgi:hypothetical protein
MIPIATPFNETIVVHRGRMPYAPTALLSLLRYDKHISVFAGWVYATMNRNIKGSLYFRWIRHQK